MTAVRAPAATRGRILIHTSVKLVTIKDALFRKVGAILIHTSVKLVTAVLGGVAVHIKILIHTSVKLVTRVVFPAPACPKF